jgi:hypothetical protein
MFSRVQSMAIIRSYPGRSFLPRRPGTLEIMKAASFGAMRKKRSMIHATRLFARTQGDTEADLTTARRKEYA